MNSPSVFDAKQTLRRTVRQTILQLTDAERLAQSQAIVSALASHPFCQQARSVLLFHPLPDEPDITPLFRIWQDEKQLLLPVIREGEMWARPFDTRVPLTVGAFSIQEPACPDHGADVAADLVIVPGRAFDKQGNRMGRGKGFYDRFFARALWQNVPKIGVGYPCQLLSHVPAEPFDVRMTCLVTGL